MLFCGNDVAQALGYEKERNAIARHCRYALKQGVPHPQSPDKTIEMSFIPESDVYRLAFGYKETAKAIREHCKGVSEMDTPTNCLANKYNRALHPGRSFCACIQIKIILKNPLDKCNKMWYDIDTGKTNLKTKQRSDCDEAKKHNAGTSRSRKVTWIFRAV